MPENHGSVFHFHKAGDMMLARIRDAQGRRILKIPDMITLMATPSTAYISDMKDIAFLDARGIRILKGVESHGTFVVDGHLLVRGRRTHLTSYFEDTVVATVELPAQPMRTRALERAFLVTNPNGQARLYSATLDLLVAFDDVDEDCPERSRRYVGLRTGGVLRVVSDEGLVVATVPVNFPVRSLVYADPWLVIQPPVGTRTVIWRRL